MLEKDYWRMELMGRYASQPRIIVREFMRDLGWITQILSIIITILLQENGLIAHRKGATQRTKIKWVSLLHIWTKSYLTEDFSKSGVVVSWSRSRQ